MKFFFIISIFLCSANIYSLDNSSKTDFVGYKACVACHQEEVKQWKTSHHKQAMQHATKDTVLGNFTQAHFENYGLITTFFKKDGQFWVNTDGSDGKLHDYQIKYTFGVYPLQQYLIEFPGGRLQTLDIAWDARPKVEGGQRWFHLHPDEKIESDDILHWTGPNMNWNYMCAFCHSTNLEKNYQIESNSYQTSWSEINVSCEACHGPAAQHLQWAKKAETNALQADKEFSNKGLKNILNGRNNVQWAIDKSSNKPYRTSKKQGNREIETCARCHSRRSQSGNDSVHQPLMDSFRPARLSSTLYYPDGQPKDEVYVYGSFIQSKMYKEGVTCSDCHNPHTNQLKLPGDQVCNQCHVSEVYRSETHHFHKNKSPESTVTCIDCHMSPTTYMGVDVRNDHSFRIPRPDLSNGSDIPNACNKCHTINTAQWSENRLKEWYKKRPVGFQKFGAALVTHQNQQVTTEKKLFELINDKEQPAIARATALEALSNYPSQKSLNLRSKQLQEQDPMIRLAALESLSRFDKRTQVKLAYPMMFDEMSSIRMEAGRILSSLPQGVLTDKDKKQLKKVQQEYLNAQMFNADRPESQVNLGNYYFQQKELKKSETHYQQAIKQQKKFVPAYLLLAQLYSQTTGEEKAQAIIKKGLKIIPDNVDLHYNLGLSFIRQNKHQESLSELQIAANNSDNQQYKYVYAIALHSLKQSEKAVEVLEQTLHNYPNDSEMLIALMTINKDIGHIQKALDYAYKLNDLKPDNRDLKNLIKQLEAANNVSKSTAKPTLQ